MAKVVPAPRVRVADFGGRECVKVPAGYSYYGFAFREGVDSIRVRARVRVSPSGKESIRRGCPA